MPAAQLVHMFESAAPRKNEAVPAAQPVHAEEPETLEYDPAGQREQVLENSEEFRPAAHTEQLEDVASA